MPELRDWLRGDGCWLPSRDNEEDRRNQDRAQLCDHDWESLDRHQNQDPAGCGD
ncbi:MAG: hypothetical protein ACUVQK_03500 [Thermogutta sp.]